LSEPQFSSQSPSSPFPDFNISPPYGPNGFDFGMQHSEQKYSDCLKKKGKPDMKAYPDWYRTD
jgi:hypothetical protein